jgi:hypothetical protein
MSGALRAYELDTWHEFFHAASGAPSAFPGISVLLVYVAGAPQPLCDSQRLTRRETPQLCVGFDYADRVRSPLDNDAGE